jgi:hypothetical protein
MSGLVFRLRRVGSIVTVLLLAVGMCGCSTQDTLGRTRQLARCTWRRMGA